MLQHSGEFTLESLEELERKDCTAHTGNTCSNTTKRDKISECKIYSGTMLYKVSIWETKNDLEKMYIHMCSLDIVGSVYHLVIYM